LNTNTAFFFYDKIKKRIIIAPALSLATLLICSESINKTLGKYDADGFYGNICDMQFMQINTWKNKPIYRGDIGEGLKYYIAINNNFPTNESYWQLKEIKTINFVFSWIYAQLKNRRKK
jgi:hypothetical protein